jgi:competence protein ComEC
MRDLRLLPAGVATWLTCALCLASPPAVLVAVGCAGAAAAAVLAAVAVRTSRPRVVGGAATACLAAAAVVVVCASLAAQLHQRTAGLLVELTADRAVVTVTGTVRGEAIPVVSAWPDSQPRFRTVVAVEQVTGRGRTGDAAAGVLVIGGEALGALPYGARVEVTGRLAAGEPGDELTAVLVVSGRATVVSDPGPVDRAVNRMRSALLEVTHGLSADARGLVPGTAIGDTTRLPADLDQAMRDVSLTHVTAVSGAHFAVLTVAVLGLTAVLRVPRRARAAATACVMAGFVVLVHPEPSVVRAAVMGVLSVLGMVLGRPSRAVPSLGAAVVVLLVADPWLARSYGFVLSVLATGAIALLGPVVATRLGRVLPRWLAVAVAVPLAAQAVCTPVLVLLQPGVSLLAVPANVLVVPALVPATVLGVAAAVFAPWFPGLAGLLAQGAGLATWWIAAVARGGAGLAGSRADWPAGPAGAVALALLTATVLAVGLSLHRWPPWARRLGAAVVGVGLVLTVCLRATVPRAVPLDWEVVQCDVGQGDMLVLWSGPSAAVVVDAGPEARSADRCLDQLGVRRVDLLVLTHHHADHVGGIAGVLGGRQVEQVLVSPLAAPAASAAATLGMLHDAGVPVLVASVDGTVVDGTVRDAVAGGEVDGTPSRPVRSGRAGSVRWTVLSPSVVPRLGAEPSGSQINNASVVLLLQTPTLVVLALGDAEADAQDAVARRLERAGVRHVDVVKVAHHGSASQSERLVDVVRPEVALISVGRDNDYGHPAAQTVRLYANGGALVLGTHECGPVSLAPVSGDGRGVRVTAACLAAD